MEASERNLSVHVVQDGDLEKFGVQLIEAVGTAQRTAAHHRVQPHGERRQGYNYAAIVTGWSDPNKVSINGE
jgi:hypothetical protein